MAQPADPLQMFASLVHADPATYTLADVVADLHTTRIVQGWIDRHQAQVLSRSNELNVSPADVLSRNAGISAAEARAKDRRSKALEQAPSFGDALAAGAVSSAHTDALANATARLDQETTALFLEHEASLLAQASHSTPEQFARHCRQLNDRIAHDQGILRSEQQKRETNLRRSICPRTGMYRINAELDPELGHRLFTNIDAEIAAIIARTEPANTDRNHLAAHALANLIAGGHQASRPAITEVVVHIDLATLIDGLHDNSICEFGDGTIIPLGTARRLACNAAIIPVVLNGDSVPVDIGRQQRLANRDQRRTLRTIYRNCAFAGCDVGFDRCEIHHLKEWTDSGQTDLANLLPICSRHHHLIHEGGWTVQLAPDRNLTIRQPDGELFAECPIQIEHGNRAAPHRQRKPDKHGNQTMQTLLA